MQAPNFIAVKSIMQADTPTVAQWRALAEFAPDTGMSTDRLLTREQGAQLLAMSVRQFDRVAKGRLKPVRFGPRCIRYRESSVLGLVAEEGGQAI